MITRTVPIRLAGLLACLALCLVAATALTQEPAPGPATAAAAPAAPAGTPAAPATSAAVAGNDDPALDMALDEEPGWRQDQAAAAAALADEESASPSQEAAAKIQELRRNEFFYQSYGRADPFKTLIAGKFEGTGGSGDLVDIASGHLVGVMWGPDDQFALVEDGHGFGYILRVGDPVQNGRIVSIRKNSLTAKVTMYGITSTVNLKLEKAEG